MSRIKVSIIVATYNAGKRINPVIDSLTTQSFREKYEVILVDDGSTDDSLDILKRIEKKNIKVRVFSQRNKGAAAARNFGIKKSRGEYIVISDDDVILGKDWLKKNIPILKNKKKGIIYSVIKNVPKKDMTALQSLLFDYAMTSRDANENNEGLMLMTNAVRKEIFKEVGLYDESFDSSGAGADVDLVYRILDEGYELAFSDVKSIHLEENQRFDLKFFIKKPYSWGKALAKLVIRHKSKHMDIKNRIISYPFAVLAIAAAIILIILNHNFLILIPIGLLIYIYLRRNMIRKLLNRGRNIFEIMFLCILDVLRVIIYNLGATSYYIFKK